MYEIFRNELIAKLDGKIDREQIDSVIGALDSIATRFSISEAQMALSIVGRRQFLDTIKLYFIIRSQEGMSPNSVKTERSILLNFAMRCTVPLQQVTANHIRSYLYNYEIQNKISKRTLQLYRCVICTFFKWCNTEGYIQKDITKVVKKINYQRKQKKALTQLQLQDVRSKCNTALQKAIVQMLYSTGCRVSELVNIKKTDIDWTNKSIVVTGKGNKTRTVYMNAKAQIALRNYMSSVKNNTEWIFTNRYHNQMKKVNVQRIFWVLSQRLDLPKGVLTPHIMRHTMATQAATICPIQQVQAMLGHANINTTMVYAEVNSQQVQAGHRLSVI